ncbi:hypothetical protein [uncultured archaeal virus]|uniref:Uncharacterized protein n=1 Tax=uncultured archaeal virus TaxID=1960247 RepID=A0A8B0LQB5_9VIRU|nr:hypothetical protein [uncultured archaeal virus]
MATIWDNVFKDIDKELDNLKIKIQKLFVDINSYQQKLNKKYKNKLKE